MQALELRGGPTSVKAARDFVRDQLSPTSSHLCETAALLVSELATNAVVHVGAPFEVWVEVLPTTVKVGVDDRDGSLPSPSPPSGDATSGRGLAMIAALSDRWGAERVSSGKRIWFELNT